jgi:hypothetical protein
MYVCMYVCMYVLCLFVLVVSFHLCPVHCPLLFVFICCAVSVVGHLAVDSAH